MPTSRSPIGIHPPSPDQRTWMILESSGSIRRNAATVSGAASSSKRAVNEKPLAVISSMCPTLTGARDPGAQQLAFLLGDAGRVPRRHRLRLHCLALDVVGVRFDLRTRLEADPE